MKSYIKIILLIILSESIFLYKINPQELRELSIEMQKKVGPFKKKIDRFLTTLEEHVKKLVREGNAKDLSDLIRRRSTIRKNYKETLEKIIWGPGDQRESYPHEDLIERLVDQWNIQLNKILLPAYSFFRTLYQLPANRHDAITKLRKEYQQLIKEAEKLAPGQSGQSLVDKLQRLNSQVPLITHDAHLLLTHQMRKAQTAVNNALRKNQLWH